MSEPSPIVVSEKKIVSNNIVLFPKMHNIPRLQSVKERTKNEQYVASVQVEQAVNEVVDDLVLSLTNNKIELDDTPACTKQFALCIEAVKSLICARRGIDYPIQKVADKLFKQTNENSVTLVSAQMINRMMKTKG